MKLTKTTSQRYYKSIIGTLESLIILHKRIEIFCVRVDAFITDFVTHCISLVLFKLVSAHNIPPSES